MKYQLEIIEDQLNLYSPRIGSYVMENASFDEVKIALATEMEYKVKLEIVKLLMTFPHGFNTMEGTKIVRKEAVENYEKWHHATHQRIGILDEYYALIDQKIVEILS